MGENREWSLEYVSWDGVRHRLKFTERGGDWWLIHRTRQSAADDWITMRMTAIEGPPEMDGDDP